MAPGRRGTITFVVVAVLGFVSFVVIQAFTGSDPKNAPQHQPHTGVTSPASPSEVGRDIGLGFQVCRVSKLEGFDLLDDGTTDTAWTAANVTSEGKCNRATDDSYLVAVDVTGDGLADASWEALKWCFMCQPLGAADFDGDGDDELVVLEQAGSVGSYLIFSAEKGSDGSVVLGPIAVAAPGNPRAELRPGRQLRFWVGGDEGYSAAVACENYPEDPIFVVAWSYQPIEGPDSDTTEVHVSHLRLRDGAFHVVDASNTEQPADETRPEVFAAGYEACGLDLRDYS